MMLLARGAFLGAPEQQPRDEHDDRKCGHVDEDRKAGNPWCRLEQAVHGGVGAQKRRPVTSRQKRRQHDTETLQQRREVIAPGNRDGNIADGVFQNQIPADDPRHQFAERGVGIGVGASGLRNHRGELGVAQAGERARDRRAAERKTPAPGRRHSGRRCPTRRPGRQRRCRWRQRCRRR